MKLAGTWQCLRTKKIVIAPTSEDSWYVLHILMMDNTDFRTIYIESFPLDTTEESLTIFLSNFGKIKRLELPKFGGEHPLNKGVSQARLKTKGYAFIEFSSKLEAQNTCAFFNDLNNILNDGKRQSNDILEKKSKRFEGEANDLKETTVSGGDECDKNNSSDSIRKKVIHSDEYKRFKLLRVMPKDTHTKFSQRFEKQRLRSLVSAAKLLMVT